MMLRGAKQTGFVLSKYVLLGLSLLLLWLDAGWAQDATRSEFVSNVERLKSKDQRVRKAAVHTLGQLEDAAAIPFLVKTLRQDGAAVIRQVAAEALGRLGYAAAMSELTRALQHDEALGVRLTAMQALGQIGDQSVQAVLIHAMQQDSVVFMRRFAARSLGQMGNRGAISALSQTLQQDEDAGVRQAAAEALQQMGDVTVVPVLSHALRHDRALRVQLAVVRSIGQISDASVVSVLVDALQHAREPLLRQSAAQVLGQIGGPAVLSALIQSLQQAQDSVDRQTAAGILGQFEGSEVILALIHTIQQDPAAHVRRVAARSLGQVGDSATVSVLARVLRQDQAVDVRRVAAHALGQIGEVTAMLTLIHTLKHDAASEVRQAALKSLLRIAYVIQDRAKILSPSDLQNAIGVLQDVPRMLQDRELAAMPIIGKQWATALRRIHATLSSQFGSPSKPVGLAILAWFYQRPWLWGSVIYVVGLLLLWVAILRLRPLWLLWVNDALKPYTDITLPAWLGNMRWSLRYVFLVGFFHYPRRVLDAWVKAHVDTVQENFVRLETVKERLAYVPMPLMLHDGASAQDLFDPHVEDFREFFLEPAAVLLIQGEEGVGKTSLACQLAASALHPDSQVRLCPHLMLPVLLEEDLTISGQDTNTVLIDAVRGVLVGLMNVSYDLSADLVGHLLRQRRILLIVDNLSGMGQETRDVIKPQRAGFLAKALIVTSRVVEQLGVNMQHVVPQRLASTHLAGFVDAYLMLKQIRHKLNDARYFDLCRRLANLADERDITVLLARMFIDQAVSSKSGDVLSKATPRNIPELMRGHLHWLNCSASGATTPLDTSLEDAAKQIAWECVKDTLCPGGAHISAIQTLLADRFGALQRLLDLGLVVCSGPAKAWIRFALDPLAEYLAGLYLVEQYGESETLWHGFLARAQVIPGAPQTIKAFLLAVRDCCAATGADAGVPDFVLVELSKGADLDSEVIENTQLEQRIRRLIIKLRAPKAADRRGAVVALGSIGLKAKAAVFVLSQALLDDTDPIVRQSAVWALGRIRTEAAVAVLGQMLLKATDLTIRQTAAETLGRIRTEAAISLLSQVRLNDTNPTVRQAAAEALGKTEPEPEPEMAPPVLDVIPQSPMATTPEISDKVLL
ncbi:MAG: HEAT repeat domain-containing protein [bacterium]|nr:HEAT repeat domain-containing protein [bacterium]